MPRTSRILVTAVATRAAVAAASVHTGETQAPQKGGAVQGWAGTPYFYHPAQIRTPGGSPGHGRWNISGIGLPDPVLRKIYYQNALRHLPSLRESIDRQLAARSH